jgi:hypothetical protein
MVKSISTARVWFLVWVVAVFSVVSAACTPKPVETTLSPVWEITVPAKMPLWLAEARDNGDAWIRRATEHGIVYPLEIIDAQGKKAGELDLFQIPGRYGTLEPLLHWPLEKGWLALDQAEGFVPKDRGSWCQGQRIRFESLLKLIDRQGRTVWETPGPASIGIAHVDESLVVCYGKDPRLLEGIASADGYRGLEYASEVAERYEAAETRVEVLDTKTGSTLSVFDIPNAQRPEDIIDGASIAIEGSGSERLLMALEHQDDAITGIVYYDLNDGAIRQSLNLRDILPDKRLRDVRHYVEGIVALSDDGSVSVVTREGRVLWTETLRGSTSGEVSSRVAGSTPEGLFMVVYTPGYSGQRNIRASLTVFDAAGETLFHVDELEKVIQEYDDPLVLALSRSERPGLNELYVFKLSGGTVNTQRALLPEVISCSVSPSGKYVLARHRSTQGIRLAMYRITG